MFRIAILAATCMSVNGEVTPASASIINKGGGIDINLADANSVFCIKGGGEVGCLKPTDVVTKGYVENVKTEFMEKTAKQLDERIEVLETDLNGKVAEVCTHFSAKLIFSLLKTYKMGQTTGLFLPTNPPALSSHNHRRDSETPFLVIHA